MATVFKSAIASFFICLFLCSPIHAWPCFPATRDVILEGRRVTVNSKNEVVDIQGGYLRWSDYFSADDHVLLGKTIDDIVARRLTYQCRDLHAADTPTFSYGGVKFNYEQADHLGYPAEIVAREKARIEAWNKRVEDCFAEALKKENIFKINEILKEAPWLVKSKEMDAAVIRAAEYVRLPILKFLIKAGANIDALSGDGLPSARGKNALAISAEFNQLQMVKYLVKKGVNANLTDMQGNTPLMKALEQGHVSVAKYLMRKTENIDAINSEGSTALILAIKKEEVDIAQYLMRKIVNVDAANSDGCTALILAVQKEWINTARYLVKKKKADIYHRDKAGLIAFDYAVIGKNAALEKLLKASEQVFPSVPATVPSPM